MPQNLIEKLKKLIDEGGSKSELERQFKLPKNSLSAVLSGHKEMPKKWVDKLTTMMSAATQVAPNAIAVSGPLVDFLKEHPSNADNQDNRQPWVKKIEDYCQEQGMTPEDLIEFVKLTKAGFKGMIATVTEKKNPVKVQDINEQAKPKGGYNRFAIKLGAKP